MCQTPHVGQRHNAVCTAVLRWRNRIFTTFECSWSGGTWLPFCDPSTFVESKLGLFKGLPGLAQDVSFEKHTGRVFLVGLLYTNTYAQQSRKGRKNAREKRGRGSQTNEKQSAEGCTRRMDMSFAGHPGPKAMRLNISPATVNTVSKTTVENVSPNSPNGADSANHAGFGKGLASNASVSPRSSSRSSGLAPKVPPAKPKQFHLHPQQQPKQRSNSQKRSPPRASSGSGSTTTASTTAGSLQVPPRERVQNGRWSIAEHNAFIAGLAKHGRNWKAIARHVITRTTVQVRTHAQKYFLKCKKTGQAEITFSSPSRRGTAGSRNSRRRSGSGSGGNDVVEHEKAKSKEASPQTTTSQSPTKRRKRKSTTLTAVTDDPQSVEVAESQKTFESPTKLRAKEADRVSTPPALAHMPRGIPIIIPFFPQIG